MVERIIQGLDALPQAVRGGVLTVGNFDGVHVGHQRILRTARELASAESAVVAMTFEPSPDHILRPKDVVQRITPIEEKARLLREGGADYVVVLTVSREFFAMTPEAFIKDVLMERFAPRHMVEGPNFFFGRGRSGDVEMLARVGPEYGFQVHIVEPVSLEFSEGRRRVSSTLIREMISAGRMKSVHRCLGRYFRLFGVVVPGTGRGSRLLKFPTVNLNCRNQVLPADGVYAAQASVEGKTVIAAVSIGENPTLGGAGHSVEAFLLDITGNFYQKQVALSLVERIRPQQKFPDAETLRHQIAKDVERVRQIME